MFCKSSMHCDFFTVINDFECIEFNSIEIRIFDITDADVVRSSLSTCIVWNGQKVWDGVT